MPAASKPHGEWESPLECKGLKLTKGSDRMGIKILIVVTCHRIFDRTEIVKKFIDEFNNSVHILIKASKKVVKILINLSYPKVADN